MPKIEIEGFLSNEAIEGRSVFKERFSDIFELARYTSRVGMAKIGEVKLTGIENSKFIIYLLTIRVLESFQAIIILMEYGMLSSAKLIMRPLLEAMFSLAAIQKDESLIEQYFDTQDRAHFELLKSTTQWKDEVLKAIYKKHKFEKKYIEKKKELKENPPKTLRPIDWARAADCEDLYNVYYVYYASFTHSNLSALEDHVDRYDDDRVDASFGPNIEGFFDILRQATAFTLISLMHMAEAFRLNI